MSILGFFSASVNCIVSNCFTSFSFPSHTSPVYSSFGTIHITFIRVHLLILVSRCEFVRIASISPTCGLSFPTTFAIIICVSQEQYFNIPTRQGIAYTGLRSAIYFLPTYFQQQFIGFTLPSLQRTSAHFLTFAVTLHFLVYSSVFSICFCKPSGVSDIPTKSSANINPDTVSSPAVTPLRCCFDFDNNYQVANNMYIYLE